MHQVGEDTTTGTISTLEFLVFSCIIQSQYPDCADWIEVNTIEAGVIHSAFQAVVAMSVALCLNLPLFSRSVEEIQKTIKRYSILYEFFFRLHQN